MTPELACLITVLVVIAAALWSALSRWPSSASASDEAGLPPELRGARLVHAEETFKSESRRLVARLDRAYELGGELVLVEFKTRRAAVVYMADVIELSIQRVALADQREVRASRTAWVVTEDSATGRRQSHRVQLLESAEVDGLRARYLAVRAGEARDPKGAKSARQCLHCGHRIGCEARRR